MMLSLVLLLCQVAAPAPNQPGVLVTASPLTVLKDWKDALDDRLTRTEQASSLQYHGMQSSFGKLSERVETFLGRVEEFFVMVKSVAADGIAMRQEVNDIQERVGPIIRLFRFVERYSILIVVGFGLYVVMQIVTFLKAIVDLVSPWLKKRPTE